MSEKIKKIGSTAAATAVAAVTAAGVLVGGAYASPEELLNDGRHYIVEAMDAAPQFDDGGSAPDGGEEEAAAEDEEKRGAGAAVRRRMRAAPVGLRAAVGVPLWGLGTAVTALASSLWSALLSPALSAALSWFGIALMAALIFTLAVKAVFPELPLKKILNRRSLLCIGILCLICGLLDAALPFFREDCRTLSGLLKLLGSFVCTAAPIAFFLRRRLRRQKRGKPEVEPAGVPAESPPEPTLAEREAAARALVEDLADSVCPRT